MVEARRQSSSASSSRREPTGTFSRTETAAAARGALTSASARGEGRGARGGDGGQGAGGRGPTDTPDDFDNTAQIYLNFLKQYDLTEADVPLLRVEYKTPFDPDNPDLTPESHEGRAVFTDVSSIATRLAATHRLSKGKKGGGTPPRRWVPGHHYRSGAAARNPPY